MPALEFGVIVGQPPARSHKGDQAQRRGRAWQERIRKRLAKEGAPGASQAQDQSDRQISLTSNGAAKAPGL